MELTGVQKAAVFLLSLPEEQALELVKHLDADELKQVHQGITKLQPVGAETIDEVYEQFAADFKAGIAPVHGGEAYLVDLVSRAQGPEHAMLLGRDAEDIVEQEPQRPFGELDGADPVTLGMTLSGEHPQVAAVVLAHIDADVAALALDVFEPESRVEVIRRVARIERVSVEALQQVSAMFDGLDLAGGLSDGINGVDTAAAILGALPSGGADEVLGELGEASPQDAVDIKRAMFTFADLAAVDKRSMQQLLREVQSDNLMTALKSAPEDVSDTIFACMSARAADMLRDELSMLGPTPRSAVEAAQQEIVDAALRMASEGRISLGKGGEEMV